MKIDISNIERYQNGYQYKDLIEKHSMNEVGIWEIRGEDPNCDLGGSHYQPVLAVVEGELGDVIKLGVNLPNFWQWGGGGDFRKIIVQTIDDLANRGALEKRKKELENEIAEIKLKLDPR